MQSLILKHLQDLGELFGNWIWTILIRLDLDAEIAHRVAVLELGAEAVLAVLANDVEEMTVLSLVLRICLYPSEILDTVHLVVENAWFAVKIAAHAQHNALFVVDHRTKGFLAVVKSRIGHVVANVLADIERLFSWRLSCCNWLFSTFLPLLNRWIGDCSV